MHRRFFSLALIGVPALLTYACSSASSKDNPTPTDEASTGADNFVPEGDGAAADGNPSDSPIGPTGNPILGITAPIVLTGTAGLAVVGPGWHGDSLFYSELKTDGTLIKLVPPSTPTSLRGPITAGNELLGTTFDEKANGFVTCEVSPVRGGQLVRSPAAGTPGTPIALVVDGGAPAFESPKNVVSRKSDGTLYVTDPAFQVSPQTDVANNHIWRIKPNGEIVDTVANGRPNGIAFAPDQKSLYVGFTGEQPQAVPAVPSKVNKYPVATDGTLGAPSLFGTVPADATVDGVAVDASGNVYVATKTGVLVLKPDGTPWGTIATTKPIGGLAFGGADKKTLFMTSDPNGMFMVTVKIAGLL